MVGLMRPLALAVCLAVTTIPMKKENWVSALGLFRIHVPSNWRLMQKVAELYEDVEMAPKAEPTVSIKIFSRRSDRPFTSIHVDQHLRGVLKDYKKQFTDVSIEKGPNRVPIGNEDSWSYLILYNTKAKDGTKVSVRETISYVDRRMADRAYLHHIIVGTCPLAMAKEWSSKVANILSTSYFMKPQKPTVTASPGAAAPDTDEDEDDSASASPGSPSPAKEAPTKASPKPKSK